MRKRFWIAGAALVLGGCLLAALSSQAADKEKTPAAPTADKDKPAAPADADQPTDIKSSEQADAVQDIDTAYKLADWGRRMDPPSPFALCTAAEILNRTTLLPGADAKDRVTVTPADSGATPEKPDVNVLKTEAAALRAFLQVQFPVRRERPPLRGRLQTRRPMLPQRLHIPAGTLLQVLQVGMLEAGPDPGLPPAVVALDHGLEAHFLRGNEHRHDG